MNLPSGVGAVRSLAPERYGRWSGTQQKYRPPSRAAAAAAIPKEVPGAPPPVQVPVPVAPTPEPIPVPRIGARPKPRAKSRAQDEELVLQAVPSKPRGRSAKRDEEDPKVVPIRSKSHEARRPSPHLAL